MIPSSLRRARYGWILSLPGFDDEEGVYLTSPRSKWSCIVSFSFPLAEGGAVDLDRIDEHAIECVGQCWCGCAWFEDLDRYLADVRAVAGDLPDAGGVLIDFLWSE